VKRCLLNALVLILAALPGWAQSRKVVVSGMGDAAVAQLQQAAPGLRIVAAPDRASLLREVAEAEAVFGTIDPELIAAGGKLKWVQVFSAGVERFVGPELAKSSITLTNCKIIQGPNIADHAFALLLTLTRQTRRAVLDTVAAEWSRGDYRMIELNGKTAVIIGVGGIGMQIAQRAHGFGMKVIGVDPKDIPYSPLLAKVVPPDRLDTVLPEADVVFVAAPLTRESQGMVGPRQFDLMKKGAYFIAVSRGRLYSKEGLIRALDSRHLAGAGLDVTDPEPLPQDDPLWKFDNVVITPHIAGQSDQVQQRRMDLLQENLRRFAKGEPLLNVVDVNKGY